MAVLTRPAVGSRFKSLVSGRAYIDFDTSDVRGLGKNSVVSKGF